MEVVRGVVAATGGDTTYEVQAGFGIVAEVGIPLQPPRALLPPPDFSGFPTVLNVFSTRIRCISCNLFVHQVKSKTAAPDACLLTEAIPLSLAFSVL